MPIHTLFIRKTDRALEFRRGDFHALLRPGVYRRLLAWDWIQGIRIERHTILDPVFEHPLKEVLVRDARLSEALHVLDLTDGQRALGWKNGRLTWILGPGLHAFWKELADLRFEIVDLDAGVLFEHAQRDAVLGHAQARRFLGIVDVEPNHEVLVFLDGELVAKRREGPIVYWKDNRKAKVHTIDLREQTADVTGQEIMTRDKVTLRVNLAVTYQVLDPLKAVTITSDSDHALYREAQLVLRAAIGGRTLDALLSDKEKVGDEIGKELAGRVEPFGVRIRSVGLRDLILPGDMKTILNQVMVAQKAAEANVIKRREETAAARSQANTARLLAENPVLAKMKELEMLQEILAGTKTTFVLGRGELAGQIRTLVEKDVLGEG
jgi:regulator of protease activity HflC (stomatin/prohibitin superfamily)